MYSFESIISDNEEKSNNKYSQWDEGVSDRELLLDAATEENASEAVLAYARKYKAYEGLLRREERLRARLEASRAAEQKQTGPADNGATEIEEKLRKCRAAACQGKPEPGGTDRPVDQGLCGPAESCLQGRGGPA